MRTRRLPDARVAAIARIAITLAGIVASCSGSRSFERVLLPPPGAGTELTLAALGDVDGDGVAEVIAGARDHDDGEDDARYGRVVVFSMRARPVLGALLGRAKYTELGDEVVLLGDLDGDGKPELAASGWTDDASGASLRTWFLLEAPVGTR